MSGANGVFFYVVCGTEWLGNVCLVEMSVGKGRVVTSRLVTSRVVRVIW